jgi:hypothetical protein
MKKKRDKNKNKSKNKKIHLSRETLRNLTKPDTSRVAGGTDTTVVSRMSCQSNCWACPP